MKSVLISIKPKYCELIANGKKTIEARKTKPKIQTPFKCYIYCTEGEALAYPHLNNPHFHFMRTNNGTSYGRKMTVVERNKSDYVFANGKVIGEFVCDDISKFTAEFTDGKTYEDIRYCYLNEYEEEEEMIVVSNEWSNPNNSWICKESCLSFDDFKKYIGINFHDIPFYAWHISDLKIYDEPKELSEFKHICIGDCDICKYCKLDVFSCIYEPRQICDNEVKRPPQSWCYVEELRDV